MNDITDTADCTNLLYFNAREWQFCKEYESTNQGERTFITGFDGNLVEAYCIGSWSAEHTEIATKSLTLKKCSEYKFIFWINGGENENLNEVCQLHIIFNNDFDAMRVYKLNRDFIKPVKRHKGWLLFEIPFSTDDNEYTQLRFVAEGAVMTIIPAKDKENYLELADYEEPLNMPQRHNVAFKNGYPDDMLNPNYFKKIQKELNINTDNDILSNAVDFISTVSDTVNEKIASPIKNKITENISNSVTKSITDEIQNAIQQQMKNSIFKDFTKKDDTDKKD